MMRIVASAFLCTALALAARTSCAQTNSSAAPVVTATRPPAGTNDPVGQEYEKLLEDDDAAHTEVDEWIRAHNAKGAAGALENQELNERILKRLDLVRAEYDNFLTRHPNHVDARIAYASFLEGIHDEAGEMSQLEKARQLDPSNPVVWNNLANYYAENSPAQKAFEYYGKAIELNTNESLYYRNLGNVVFMFRPDAREYYHISEQQVFDKAMSLYDRAERLDPTNFLLAVDVAQSYYAIKPYRFADAQKAWNNALNLASDEIEREGIYIHLARMKILAGRFDEARAQLSPVTNNYYAGIRGVLTRNINEREQAARDTNAAVVVEPAATAQLTKTNRLESR
jgi:tetratricopeptide (TPR) repeat protein